MRLNQTLLRGLLITVAFALSSGCSMLSPKADEEEASQPEQQFEEKIVELAYFDSNVFDQSIGRQMSIPKRYILVDFPETMTLSQIPPRIENWLQRVSANQGQVELEPVDPDETDRSLALAEPLISLLIEAYFSSDEDEVDTLGRDYNIRIYYSKDSGVINKLLFYPTDQKQ